MEEQFKPSFLILSLFLILVWFCITYFLYDCMSAAGFPLYGFLALPVWLFLTYMLLINSVKLFIEQVKLLGKKK